MFKKIIVLAMAVGVVAALALPTAASAAWKHHQTQIAHNVAIPFTGNFVYSSAIGGISCQVTSETQFFTGQTTGEIETLDVHPGDETTNCKGTGSLSPCQVHNLTPQVGLNWGFHTTGTVEKPSIQLTTGTLSYQMTGSFCGAKKIQTTPGNLTATPNQPNTFTSITLSGGLQAHIETNNGLVHPTAITVSGSLTIEEAAKKHTYSI